MDEQCVVHPGIVPDAGSAPERETQHFDFGRAGIAGFKGANIRSKRDRKPAARGGVAHRLLFCRRSDRRILIWRKVGLPRHLFFRRAAGTAIGFARVENRDRGFVLEFPQEIAGNGLEKPAFDGAPAPASSA
jgi:hypothetical protein